ncbi:hypothetical protein [Candidatus Avelusimicrobium faecicola]|uniref:hypothetical protein n=1 Tax=Candidatus Avelusimicrobium faecicola TaxID=3416205 RepID=UPI003D1214DD
MAHAKEVLFFEKAGAKIKKPKTPLKLRYAKKCCFLQTNEKCKNECDFARRLICAEKMHGAKNGCNLLTGQKAAKAGWRVFDSGRRGGQSGPFAEKKTAGTGGGLIGAICKNALCRLCKNTPYKRQNRELFKIRPNLICGVYRYPPFAILGAESRRGGTLGH